MVAGEKKSIPTVQRFRPRTGRVPRTMEKQILAAIDAGDFNTHAFAVASGADHQAVIGPSKHISMVHRLAHAPHGGRGGLDAQYRATTLFPLDWMLIAALLLYPRQAA